MFSAIGFVAFVQQRSANLRRRLSDRYRAAKRGLFFQTEPRCFTRLLLETLEARRVLNGAEWLVRLTGLPGDTVEDQMHAAQARFYAAGLTDDQVLVVDHTGIAGDIVVEAPEDVTEDELEDELLSVPGFDSVQEFQDEDEDGAVDPDAPDLSEMAAGANIFVGLNGNEPTIAVNPLNPNNVVVAQFNNGSQTLKISLDGGATFAVSRNGVLPSGQTSFSGDDSVTFDSQGRLFWTYLTSGSGSTGGPNVVELQVDPTTAAVVSGPNLVTPAVAHLDKEWISADKNPNSPFHDNLYVVWNDFNQLNGPVRFARS